MILRIVASLAALAATASSGDMPRELTCMGATTGREVPLFSNGYLVFQRNQHARLEVYRPDGSLQYDMTPECLDGPGCAFGPVAIDPRGTLAIGIYYPTPSGKAAGIRFLNQQGGQTRFIETGDYVPTALCFDFKGGLWTMGWHRGPDDSELKDESMLVRKYSAGGAELGRFLPRSIWKNPKTYPAGVGGGYWRMAAAADRVGVIVHEATFDSPAEWVEWDLNGNLLARTPAPNKFGHGRAYTASGQLYMRVQTGEDQVELRRPDRSTGIWQPVADNIPEWSRGQIALLMGADGDDLVYRIGAGNTRLLWARPGEP